MRRKNYEAKRFNENTGKLHIPCPYREKTGICIPVIVKNYCCYRSDVCFVFECKFHKLQGDLDAILSVVW